MYVPLSAFRNFTRFAINPDRIGVIESGYYTGCVEVHLANYRYQEATLPGGIGLTLAGKHDSMRERASGQLALIAGFNEVFKIACTYDGCVVLRPLGIGIGHRSQLASRYSNMRSRKRRIQKKHAKKAAQFQPFFCSWATRARATSRAWCRVVAWMGVARCHLSVRSSK